MSLPWSQFYSLLSNKHWKISLSFLASTESKGLFRGRSPGGELLRRGAEPRTQCTESTDNPMRHECTLCPVRKPLRCFRKTLHGALFLHSPAQGRFSHRTGVHLSCSKVYKQLPSRAYKVCPWGLPSDAGGGQTPQEGCKNIGWPMGLMSKTHS